MQEQIRRLTDQGLAYALMMHRLPNGNALNEGDMVVVVQEIARRHVAAPSSTNNNDSSSGKKDRGTNMNEKAMKMKVNEDGTTRGSVNIMRSGEQIILPEGMGYAEAITWLDRQARAEEAAFNFEHVIDAFPLEGAFALAEVLKSRYGFTMQTQPFLISIDTDVNQSAPVPWGEFEIPGIDGKVEPTVIFKDGRLQFGITGKTKMKHREEVELIAQLVKEHVKTASVYRGKAIKVKFPKSPKEFNVRDCPKFLDLSKVDEHQLVFSEDIAKIVQSSLFTPIEKTEMCRQYKVPLKRGILLEGTYGTGKTLTAFVAAKKCIQNGWTFIYLESVAQLAEAIAFSKQYQPCVIFAEDIDRVVAGDRSVDMDAILNTIDGIDNKSSETLVVLTTNDVGSINKAMLRPGRLDAVISVTAPDADAVIRLVKLYAGDLLAEGEDFAKVGKMLEGNIPAVIREVVERSKLAAITRLDAGEPLQLRAPDLELASDTLIRHLALLAEDEDDDRSNAEKLVDYLFGKLEEAVDVVNEGGGDDDEEFHELTGKSSNGKGKLAATA